MAPNRVVAIASVVVSLALAVLPVVADMDWTSTAGVLAGIVAVLAVVQKWLDGWQKHEAIQAVSDDDTLEPADDEHAGAMGIPELPPSAVPADEGDAESAHV